MAMARKKVLTGYITRIGSVDYVDGNGRLAFSAHDVMTEPVAIRSSTTAGDLVAQPADGET